MPNNKGRLAGLVCLLSLSGAWACVPAGVFDETASVQTEGSGDGETPAAGGREVQLQMAAGPIGDRLMVTNHSNDPFENIVMIVNEDEGGGYKLNISRMEAQASLHFGLKAFRNSEGERYDPNQSWVKTVTVLADTAGNRGRWRSSYPKR